MTVSETNDQPTLDFLKAIDIWKRRCFSAESEVARFTAALSDQPNGWQAVPKEPTKEMAEAGRKATAVVADRMEEAKLLATSIIDFWQRVGHEPVNEIYRAMIAAAPPPSSTAGRGNR